MSEQFECDDATRDHIQLWLGEGWLSVDTEESLTIEAQIMIEQDRALQRWLGEILSNNDLYENTEFDWFRWCNDTKNDLNERVRLRHLRPVMLDARKAAELEATTAKVVDLQPQSPTFTGDMAA